MAGESELRLNIEGLSQEVSSSISALDALVREYPEVATETLSVLRVAPETRSFDQLLKTKIAAAAARVIDLTDDGRRLRSAYDERTFDLILDSIDYASLVGARREGDPDADQKIAYFGLYVYAARVATEAATETAIIGRPEVLAA